MAPNVATTRGRSAVEPSREVPAPPQAGPVAMAETAKAGELRRLLRELRSHVEQNCDYVGEDFVEEARKIHYGETDPRGIYGETSDRSEEHTSELPSLMRTSYAVFGLKKKKNHTST